LSTVPINFSREKKLSSMTQLLQDIDVRKALAAGAVSYGINRYYNNRDLPKLAAVGAASSVVADVAGSYVGGAHQRGVKILASGVTYYAITKQMQLGQNGSSPWKMMLIGAGTEVVAGAAKVAVERLTGMQSNDVSPHTISNFIGTSAAMV
jgi:hypothetical protein